MAEVLHRSSQMVVRHSSQVVELLQEVHHSSLERLVEHHNSQALGIQVELLDACLVEASLRRSSCGNV